MTFDPIAADLAVRAARATAGSARPDAPVVRGPPDPHPAAPPPPAARVAADLHGLARWVEPAPRRDLPARAEPRPAGATRDTGSPMAKVTLQSIADRVGVSRMTVSNAFSRPDQLSADLRARILAAADELGYVGPDPAARALARGRTGVGRHGAQRPPERRVRGRDRLRVLRLGRRHPGRQRPRAHPARRRAATTTSRLATSRWTAPCSTSASPTRSTSPGWTAAGCPRSRSTRTSASGVASVNVDDRGGARSAAQHLVDLGHTRIGILTLAGQLRRPVAELPRHPADARLARRPRRRPASSRWSPRRPTGRRRAAQDAALDAARPARPSDRARLLLRRLRPRRDPGRRVARPVGARRRLGRRLRRQPARGGRPPAADDRPPGRRPQGRARGRLAAGGDARAAARRTTCCSRRSWSSARAPRRRAADPHPRATRRTTRLRTHPPPIERADVAILDGGSAHRAADSWRKSWQPHPTPPRSWLPSSSAPSCSSSAAAAPPSWPPAATPASGSAGSASPWPSASPSW